MLGIKPGSQASQASIPLVTATAMIPDALFVPQKQRWDSCCLSEPLTQKCNDNIFFLSLCSIVSTTPLSLVATITFQIRCCLVKESTKMSYLNCIKITNICFILV